MPLCRSGRPSLCTTSFRGIAVLVLLLGTWSCSREYSPFDAMAPAAQPVPSLRVAPPGLSADMAPPVVVQSHSTEWSEYVVGTQPAGWTQLWDATPYFQVASEPSVASGKVLQWSGTQPRNRWALVYDAFGDIGDQEVLTDFRARTLSAAAAEPLYFLGTAAVRVSGTASDEHGYAIFFVHEPPTGQRYLALATWVNGFYQPLDSYALNWQLDTWYSVRLQAVGTRIRGRIWPRGTTEPTSWQLDAVDVNYSSGRPGVSQHDDGTVQWARWTASILSDTSTATPPTGMSFQTSFAEYATGSQPVSWTETANPASSSWTVSADPTVADGRVVRNVTTATSRHLLRYDPVPDTTTTQEVLVRMRLADDDDRGPGVALRHTMQQDGSETAYVAYLRSGSDQVEIDGIVAGTWQFIAAAPFVNDPGQWYWMRFRADGPALLLRVWADGTPEPSAWTYRGSNADITAGSVGLYTYEPNTVDYDVFSVATGGLTAPTPVQGPPPPPPTITQVNVSPSAPSVPAGGTAQFQATVSMSDGTTTSSAVTWTATGGTISSSGLFIAGASPGTYLVTATEPGSGLSGTASVTVTAAPPTPPSSSTWQTAFDDYTIGAQPNGWTETAYPNNSTWTVAAEATVADGRVLRNVSTATSRHILRYDGFADTTTAQEVLVELRLGDDDDRGPGIALRHTMQQDGSETAYVAYLRSGTDEVELNAFLAGGWQFIASAPFVNDPGRWYWMRFRAEGTTLRVRVWADGTSEPSAWTVTATHSAIAAGALGVYTYEPNTVDYDVFSAATGGATAPTPVPSTPPPPTITRIDVSPAAPSITVGATVQFQATASMSDGGTTSPAVTWSATGGTISSSGLFAPGSNPGTYLVTATEPGSGLSGTASVAVAARQVTVTVQNASRLFGQPNPPFVGTTQGLLSGDALTCSYATSATPTSPVGTYPITAACTPTPTYTVTVVPGTLTVGPATPTIVWNPADVTNPNPLGAAQLNAVAVGVDGQALSGTMAYSTNGTTVSAGTVLRPGLNTPLTVRFTPNGSGAANYTTATTTASTFNVLNTIDITPNVSANYIYLTSGATEISLAILGTASFDARTVVVSSLTPTLGNGTNPGARLNVFAGGAPKTVVIDINGDGRTDLVCYYLKSDVINAAGVTTSTTQLVLLGETTDGRKIKGVDQVIVMP